MIPVRLSDQYAILSTEDEELKVHIYSLFKNSKTLKGIKGRDKWRKVEVIGGFPTGPPIAYKRP